MTAPARSAVASRRRHSSSRSAALLALAMALLLASPPATLARKLPPLPKRVADFPTVILGNRILVFPNMNMHWSMDLSQGSVSWVQKSGGSSDDDDASGGGAYLDFVDADDVAAVATAAGESRSDVAVGTDAGVYADEAAGDAGGRAHPLGGWRSLRAADDDTGARLRATARTRFPRILRDSERGRDIMDPLSPGYVPVWRRMLVDSDGQLTGDTQPVYGCDGYIAGAAAASVEYDHVYVAGGGLNTGGKSPKYNPVTKAWALRPEKGQRLHPLPDLPYPTAYPAAVVSDMVSKLFIIGGVDPKSSLNTVFSLDLKQWHEAKDPSTIIWATEKPMNEMRQGASAVVVGTSVFAFGGVPNIGARFYKRDMEELDLTNTTLGWREVEGALMHQGGAFMGAAFFKCDIYRFGGATGTSVADIPTVEKFDPTERTPRWTLLDKNLTTAVSHAGTVQHGVDFYIVGGSSGGSSGELVSVQTFSVDCPANTTGTDCKDCASGYWGPTCSPCPGIIAAPCVGPCFGHGTCSGSGSHNGTGVCTCDPLYRNPAHPDCSQCIASRADPLGGCQQCSADYYGPTCEPCAGTIATGHACNGHGTCNGGGTHSGTGACTCDTGWKGDQCDLCDDGYFGSECLPCPGVVGGIGICNQHGTCSDTKNGTGLCTCDSDSLWVGPKCCTYDKCPEAAPLLLIAVAIIVAAAIVAAYLRLNVQARIVLLLFFPTLQIMGMFSMHPVLRSADVSGKSVMASTYRAVLQHLGLVASVDFTNWRYMLWCVTDSTAYSYITLWSMVLITLAVALLAVGITYTLYRFRAKLNIMRANSTMKPLLTVPMDRSDSVVDEPVGSHILTGERIFGGSVYALCLLGAALMEKSLEAVHCTTSPQCDPDRSANFCRDKHESAVSTMGIVSLLLCVFGIPTAVFLLLQRDDEPSPHSGGGGSRHKKKHGKGKRSDELSPLHGGVDRSASTWIKAPFHADQWWWILAFQGRRWAAAGIAQSGGSWATHLGLFLALNIVWTVVREYRQPFRWPMFRKLDRALTALEVVVVVCNAVMAAAGVHLDPGQARGGGSNVTIANATVVAVTGIVGMVAIVAAAGVVVGACIYLTVAVSRRKSLIEMSDDNLLVGEPVTSSFSPIAGRPDKSPKGSGAGAAGVGPGKGKSGNKSGKGKGKGKKKKDKEGKAAAYTAPAALADEKPAPAFAGAGDSGGSGGSDEVKGGEAAGNGSSAKKDKAGKKDKSGKKGKKKPKKGLPEGTVSGRLAKLM